jgi:hypothetical protein
MLTDKQLMTTRRSIFCQVEGSLLALMFGGRWKGNMMRDKDGRFFLDFNNFKNILVLYWIIFVHKKSPNCPKFS